MLERRSDRNAAWASAIFAVLAFAWLYGPLLTGRVAAFRDTYHFYYPLAVWLDAQWQQGHWLPLYNPYDGTGANLLGESSSGLLYPGRLCLHLPWLNLPQRMGLMLLAHNLLAAMGALYAARRMQLTWPAQMLAALAYGLSGPVFFQIYNPIFLVGAAWLPWALAECWVLSRSGAGNVADVTDCPATAGTPAQPAVRWWLWIVANSLMLLGGDAQSTVHVGLLTGVAAVMASWRARQPQSTQSLRWQVLQFNVRIALQNLGKVALAVVVVSGLTAAQWLPSWYWLQHAQSITSQDRACITDAAIARDQVPELLRPLAHDARRSTSEFLLATESSGRGSPYAYSVAPWHLLTLGWSTIGGQLLPFRARVFELLSAEPQMWVPSLSVGLVTMLLAMVTLCAASGRRINFFWIVTLGLSAGAMLGNYAPAWVLRNLCLWIGQEDWARHLPADQTWGIYWLLTEIVPFYSSFRYPAKWSVVFALALTMLAAYSLDNKSCDWQILRRGSWCISLLSLCGLVLWTLVGNWQALWQPLKSRLVSVAVDPWLGMVSPAATWWQVWWALLMSCLLGGLVTWSLRGHRARMRAYLYLWLLMVELTISASSWRTSTTIVNGLPATGLASPTSPTVDQADIRRLWSAIGRADISHDRSIATDPAPAWASSNEHIDRRVSALCEYQHQFMLGKLHLLHEDLGNLSAFMTLPSRALAQVRRRLAHHDRLSPDDPALESALAWLGVHARLTRPANDARKAGPRLVYQAVAKPAGLIESDLNSLHVNQNTLHVNKHALSINYYHPTSEARQIALVNSGPQIIIQANCLHDCDIVVRLYQDGGWRARLSDAVGRSIERRPLKSHLGLFQRFSLPAGKWTVELHYEPPGWRWGAGISLMTLAALIGSIPVIFFLRFFFRDIIR